MSKAAILIPGRLHPHAESRIREAFEVVSIARPDAMLLDEPDRERIRGIAVASGIRAQSVDGEFLGAFPKLEIVASFGVGYDHLDAARAASLGIMVSNTPDVLSEEVADTAVALLINTVRELPMAEAWLRQGKWHSVGSYPLTKGTLRGRSVGIFGMGRIGLAIAKRLEAFGLPISYHNRRKVDGVDYGYHESLVELARAVDTLISIAPGGTSTEKAVNAEVLRALGPSGVLINVGRGTTVDEDALIAALADGTIMSAGLDVFANEPDVPEALIEARNASLLPHVASASMHTRTAMADLVADNLLAWFRTGRALTPVRETAHITGP
ncbi:2-hydroxyacid dehydrogenase [Mesorhizobium sp. CAU 1741]|uniref:2-hydroxyacid dehydrogenase n=1 Tax=Mesorhizobium sp. CAU 1741 TaxID=3140366 RepID=UPI00325AA2DF